MNTEIAVVQQDPYLLSPVMNIALAKQRLQEFQSFIRDYLVEGEDFGKIPGANKPCLLKPGADKLCELYGLADDYIFIERIEDFDKSLFDYTFKCILTDRRRGIMVSTGFGSCNSMEQKYRWRDSKRLCPQCGKEAIIKGKEEYGGGFLCFAKKGGCGAKFSDTDKSIIDQVVGRTMNEDIADLKNTILKMAKKRAKIDATLSATRSSGVFTQDIEDMPHFAPEQIIEQKAEPQKATPEKPAATPEVDIEAECVKWLDVITPLSPEEFLEGIVPLLKEKGPASMFVRCIDPNLLAVVCNRLTSAETFSAVLVPLQRLAHDAGRKDLIKAVAAEAKNRGYKVNRVNGTYVGPAKPDPTEAEYEAKYQERQAQK